MSSATGWLKVSLPSPHVLHVQLARAPVNAFSEQFWREYGQFFDRLNDDGEASDIRAVVLSSTLPKLFTAGLDLSATNNLHDPTAEPARQAIALQNLLSQFQRAIGAPERCRCPVIVAVHGPVIGLGIDLISYCDIRYAASDTLFSIKEVDIGLAADIGTLALLPKITKNDSLLRELAYTARSFSAAEAEKLGLVSKVIQGSRDQVVNAALELAAIIARKSPLAVMGTKRFVNHARDHTVADSLEYAAIWNSAALQTKDIAKNVAGAQTKQQPTFSSVNAKL